MLWQNPKHGKANFRKTLLQNGIDLYNGGVKVINYPLLGRYGSCTVKVEGEVSTANRRDKTQYSLPPHSPTTNMHLAVSVQRF
jgi:hypothetical protein